MEIVVRDGSDAQILSYDIEIPDNIIGNYIAENAAEYFR
jgi:hypothetical protein